MPNKKLTDLPAWKALQAHRQEMENIVLRDLFTSDPGRFDQFHVELDGFLFDYSRHKITTQTIELLTALAEARGLKKSIEDMLAGKKINVTEKRAALHMALRGTQVADTKTTSFVKEQLGVIKTISNRIRSDKTIKAIVHIGTGGSDLGPRMLCGILEKSGPHCYFINNADASDILSVLHDLEPESTIFIIASKSFSTAESLLNASTAKNWLKKSLDEATALKHFYAVTENSEAAQKWGVPADQILPLYDWIGGRFSLWSSIGLSIAVSAGFETFQELLGGAAAMDEHFLAIPFDKNIPVLMAVLGTWYRNFWNYPAHAVIPYAQGLEKFHAYIQQLEMESNGKTTDRDGQKIDYATAPVVIGDVGTNAQHAFLQCFHQGSDITPCDLIVGAHDEHALPDHHAMLVCNALAQGEALMLGSENSKEPHRHFGGGRPSSTFLLGRFDARHLGMLIAAYEHKVFVQGVIWNINSFDQWGVELGKTLARTLIKGFESGRVPPGLDSSTAALLGRLINKKG